MNGVKVLKLQESGEMYLESILVLSGRLNVVHAVDICEYRGVSKPSVSRAIGILKSGGYVSDSSEGGLVLTEEGRRVASKIYERHTVLTECLLMLGVPEEAAAEDACKFEHVISDVTFDKIKEHMKKYSRK